MNIDIDIYTPLPCIMSITDWYHVMFTCAADSALAGAWTEGAA